LGDNSLCFKSMSGRYGVGGRSTIGGRCNFRMSLLSFFHLTGQEGDSLGTLRADFEGGVSFGGGILWDSVSSWGIGKSAPPLERRISTYAER
jgi:hypothetical protein